MYASPLTLALRTASTIGKITVGVLLLSLAGCGKSPTAPPLPASSGLGAPIAGSAQPATLVARLSGSSEVPPVNVGGIGIADVTLNMSSNVLTWKVTYSGLIGAVSGAHFHGPAASSENAGVVVPVSGNLASPISGMATLTSAQASDLLAGKWYFNIHTAANPNGEIRGQLNVQP